MDRLDPLAEIPGLRFVRQADATSPYHLQLRMELRSSGPDALALHRGTRCLPESPEFEGCVRLALQMPADIMIGDMGNEYLFICYDCDPSALKAVSHQ